MYGEGGEQNRDAKGGDAAFSGWYEIISYIPGFWENIVTGGKRDKTKLIASRSHSLAPHSSAHFWQQRALPPAGDKEETLKPSAAQMCKCNYTERAGLKRPSPLEKSSLSLEPKLLLQQEMLWDHKPPPPLQNKCARPEQSGRLLPARLM